MKIKILSLIFFCSLEQVGFGSQKIKPLNTFFNMVLQHAQTRMEETKNIWEQEKDKGLDHNEDYKEHMLKYLLTSGKTKAADFQGFLELLMK